MEDVSFSNGKGTFFFAGFIETENYLYTKKITTVR